MPKEMEERLKKVAAKRGLTGKSADRFVYGTMRNKTDYIPTHQKDSSTHTSKERLVSEQPKSDKDKSAKNYVIKGRLLKNFKR